MLTARARSEADYDYYFLRLAEIGDATEMPREALSEARRNGLLATWPGGIVLLTGARGGVMSVDLEAWDAAPPDPGSNWEDVVEATYQSVAGVLYVLDLWGTHRPTSGELLHLPHGAGKYQVRALARNRAAARAITASGDHVESMLVQFWPSLTTPEKCT